MNVYRIEDDATATIFLDWSEVFSVEQDVDGLTLCLQDDEILDRLIDELKHLN